MNEHLYTTDDGLRLIQEFEGAPRLKARLCEGGAWELSYGVTFRPDGTRIREGETCTETEAMTLFRHALGVFEQAVRDMVTVPLEPHQFSALVAWVYNIGIENARSSTVLREVNANRVYDAAAAFGMWIYATKNEYKQALRGLLRRRYAEACLFLGYQWSEACADEAIALQRERPTSLPGKDKVIYKTPFKDVLAVAQHYPLDASPEPAYAQVPVLLPTEPARIEAPRAGLPDSPAGVPLDGIPTQLPLPDPIEDELFLDTPAATEETSVSKGSPPVSEPPSPSSQAAVPSQPDSNPAASPAGSAGRPDPIAPSPPVVLPSPLPPPPPIPRPSNVPAPRPFDPPVIAGQGGLKPMHPETKMPDMIPYRIDPNAGAKPLESTERFLGSVFILLGTLTRTAMANGFKLSGAGGVIVAWILTLMKDPVHFAIFVAFCAMAITGTLWLFGVCLQKFGVKKKRKGEAGSSQLMY